MSQRRPEAPLFWRSLSCLPHRGMNHVIPARARRNITAQAPDKPSIAQVRYLSVRCHSTAAGGTLLPRLGLRTLMSERIWTNDEIETAEGADWSPLTALPPIG